MVRIRREARWVYFIHWNVLLPKSNRNIYESRIQQTPAEARRPQTNPKQTLADPRRPHQTPADPCGSLQTASDPRGPQDVAMLIKALCNDSSDVWVSIHPFSVPASFQFQVAGVCWSLSQHSRGERRGNPWIGRQPVAAIRYSFMYLTL